MSIATASGAVREEQVKKILENILEKYELAPYTFTDTVRIESYVKPHSHPVLTLNTYKFDEHHLLSVYVHEQIHWFLDEKEQKAEAVIAELREHYEEVPVGDPEGAPSEYSTYLHLIVCPLEYTALKRLLGDPAAKELLHEKNFYQWIHKTTIHDYEFLMDIIRKHGLEIE
ncbi:hypothetical protein BRC19_02995 [Candidatus Saccharibacteria bacterium QS_5_54_17]|nr:MAG: hypothetical protein BRC19_02995 [Candidatus Saccharibacteria bacterium QS_5_54_17]